MGLIKTFFKKLVPDKDPELVEYEQELKADFAKKSLKAKYDNKLKDIKKGKKSGFANFGDSLLKASDKINDYDWQGKSSSSSNKFDMLGKK